MSELKHYGVKGMKWGVRKSQIKDAIRKTKNRNKSYKDKIQSLSDKNNGIHRSDQERFRKQKLTLKERVWDNLTPAVSQAFMGDILTGDFNPTNKEYISKKVATIAKSAIAKTAMDEALAYSASRKYTSGGKLKKGDVNSLVTREDILGSVPEAVDAVKGMIPVVKDIKNAAKDSYNKAAASNSKEKTKDVFTDKNTQAATKDILLDEEED